MFTFKSQSERLSENLDMCDFRDYLMSVLNVSNDIQFETKLKMILLNPEMFYTLLDVIDMDKREFFENISRTPQIEFIYNKRFSGTMHRLYFTPPKPDSLLEELEKQHTEKRHAKRKAAKSIRK